MDLILIYSSYSTACSELFQLFPNLKADKGIQADTKDMREWLEKRLKIIVVPTLLVTSDKQIFQRIVGLEPIKNWLWITFNQSEMPPVESDIPSKQQTTTLQFEDELMPPPMPDEAPPLESTYKLKTGSVKAAAEELARERERELHIEKKRIA